jgi:CMP-N,N'-diacetyllegionaminic acid synthase
MGKSLLSYTVREALNASSVDRLICSTDCAAIASEAEVCGCEVPFIRPPSLSTDVASSVDVLMHSVRQFPEYDYVVLLQPTSPCRTSHDIDNAFDLLAREQADSCLSLCRGGKPGLPAYSTTAGSKLVEAITSGEHEFNSLVIYRPNGALYLTSTNRLLETKELVGGAIAGYVMGDDQSIDIDTQADFDAAEAVIKARAAKL